MWILPERSPNEPEKRVMLAMAVTAGVVGVMENHVYRFDKDIRRQRDGGSIGNSLTGEVAKVVMAWWTRKFLTLAKTATSHMMDQFITNSGLYIDDDNLVYFTLPHGARWSDQEQRMEVRPELVNGDLEVPDDVRTMKEMRKMADSICPIIQMTEDCPGMNRDGKLPILDLKVWVDNKGEILYEYYRKEMARRFLILARSAMPAKVKRASLTQEAIRILKNTSPGVPAHRTDEILSDFCLRMKLSGYPEKYRANIINSALTAWDRMVEMDESGEKPLHRERSWRKEERSLDKERKKAGWFKTGGEVSDFPIFCPMTPGGRLAAKWRKVVEESRITSSGDVRAKVVEQGGVPLHAILVKPLPRSDDTCTKRDCQPCQGEQTRHLSCHKGTLGGVGYELQCNICKEEDKVAVYHGESSRTFYTRTKEHMAGYTSKRKENPILKHQTNFHPGQEPNYIMKALKFYKDPLTRQINEGVRINNTRSTPGYLMNSKSEFRQGEVARVTIDTFGVSDNTG